MDSLNISTFTRLWHYFTRDPNFSSKNWNGTWSKSRLLCSTTRWPRLFEVPITTTVSPFISVGSVSLFLSSAKYDEKIVRNVFEKWLIRCESKHTWKWHFHHSRLRIAAFLVTDYRVRPTRWNRWRSFLQKKTNKLQCKLEVIGIRSILMNDALTKSKPNKLHVCSMIFWLHFSLGSGGGVPVIGCGRGRLNETPLLMPTPAVEFIVFLLKAVFADDTATWLTVRDIKPFEMTRPKRKERD